MKRKVFKTIEIEEEVELTWEILRKILDDYDIFNIEDSDDCVALVEFLSENDGISPNELEPFRDDMIKYYKEREFKENYEDIGEYLDRPLSELVCDYYSEKEIHDYITYWFKEHEQ